MVRELFTLDPNPPKKEDQKEDQKEEDKFEKGSGTKFERDAVENQPRDVLDERARVPIRHDLEYFKRLRDVSDRMNHYKNSGRGRSCIA